MFALKQSICYPGFGAKANEDIIGYGETYCFAIDGASCLSGKNIIDPVSDSAWMVRKVRDGLCALLDSGDPRPTRQLLKEVVAQIREEYLQALQQTGVSAPEDSPSAGLAMFRQRNGKLEFFGMGDCVGVAILPSGQDFHALDYDLPALDDQVLDRMLQLHQQTGISMKEAKIACTDMLLKNRNMRNHPDGYWILDLLTDDGIINAQEESWDLTEPVCAGCFSDGFAQLVEVIHQYPDYASLFDAMQKTDLEQMFQQLCAQQDADPELSRFPRFKHRDDTCALWGIFRPDCE